MRQGSLCKSGSWVLRIHHAKENTMNPMNLGGSEYNGDVIQITNCCVKSFQDQGLMVQFRQWKAALYFSAEWPLGMTGMFCFCLSRANSFNQPVFQQS